MKNLLSLCLTALSFVAFSADAKDEKQLVAITQFVSHPALDAAYKGIVDELAKLGFKKGENIEIIYEIAQSDQALQTQIAQRFAGKKPAVAVGISTPSAQTLKVAAHEQFPIVFSAVTDPVAADLLKNKGAPEGNITGASDSVAFSEGVKMIGEFLPDAKTIGTVYNPGEANSQAAIRELEAVLKEKNIKLISAPAARSSEVLDAARSLNGKVDAIYLTLDNTAISSIASVIQVCEQNKIPLFTVDTSSVSDGAIAALGFSYYEHGKETGKLIAKVLQGEKISNIPVKTMETLELHLNPKAAERMGLKVSDELQKSAKHIINK